MTTIPRKIGYGLIAIAIILASDIVLFVNKYSRRVAYDPTSLNDVQAKLQAEFMTANAARTKEVEPLVRLSGGPVVAYLFGGEVSKYPPEFMRPDGTAALTRAQKWIITDHSLVKNPLFPFIGEDSVYEKVRYDIALGIVAGAAISMIAMFLCTLFWMKKYHEKDVVVASSVLLVTSAVITTLIYYDIVLPTISRMEILGWACAYFTVMTVYTIGFYVLHRYPKPGAVTP